MKIIEMTPYSAELLVAGGLLRLKRAGLGHRWEICLYERKWFSYATFGPGMTFHTAELSPSQYLDKSFAEPVQAAEFICRLVAA